MERLAFILPDFTRLSWVSNAARETWEPRLISITKAWMEIERLSIASGVRACAMTMASPQEFLNRGGEWVKQGLGVLPVEFQASPDYLMVDAKKLEQEETFFFRFILGKPGDVSDFNDALDADDHRKIAMLLGHPTCCQKFLREVWVKDGLMDTTWPMASATVPSPEGTRHLEIDGPPETNALWRWVGIRAVPHLPCRFDCEHSLELSRKLVQVGREAGYASEMEWLLTILSWPVEWSALHGIAEIKTPILKISTRTDATPFKYTVRRRGDAYPSEGASGLNFPYRLPPRPRASLVRLNASRDNS